MSEENTRSTNLEMEMRKERIRKWMIQGLSDRDIKNLLVNPLPDPNGEQDKPLSARQASRYIKQVQEEWAEEPEQNVNTSRNKYVESQLDIYRELRLDGSVQALKEASNILDKIAKTQKVFEEQDSTSEGIKVVFVDSAKTPNEAEQQLEELMNEN